ncbi:hypothetical protein [Ornithinicoccus hortensis]|uniref:Uncharacterized protein n=1 Tax=Ornithinicoccus hortensis TaxID=82346 RepID=A0A542YM52_9MICO|nr:hypothetical protein [Ornithinicoccus hortensis]TQL49168.1 hypothetical protein FB467_0233 [Ornithinicoccus hortensis]
MTSDEESWLHDQLLLDPPPPMAPLDGQAALGRARRHRRRRRVTTAAGCAAAGVLVAGTTFWAAGLLPDTLQDALPAAPGTTAACPEFIAGGDDPAGPGSRTGVASSVTDLALLDWVAEDGVHVWVIRTTDGCLVPSGPDAGGPSASGVGVSVLTQEPGGPVVLHGSRDPGEDVRTWGAQLLPIPGQASAIAIVPADADLAVLPGGDPVEDLTPVRDEDGTVLAAVARSPYPDDQPPAAVLWRAGEIWSLQWVSADVVVTPVAEGGADPGGRAGSGTPTPTPAWSSPPQLVRAEGGGGWWAWTGTSVVASGPRETPEGPWAIQLPDEGGDVVIGWLPEGTEEIAVDGRPRTLLPVTQTAGLPLDGLRPFMTDGPAQRIEALGSDGARTEVPILPDAATD